MVLEQLSVTALRCIGQAELALASGVNLVSGQNGSGKTSLLEAVYLLGRGRSFRSRSNEKLIQNGQAQLTVFGRLTGQGRGIGLRASREGPTEARIAAQPVKTLAELSAAFPVHVIDPDIHALVEQGGQPRRRWLDWAVFHVEPSFLGQWMRYSRAVKQRNAALRAGRSDFGVWDTELVLAGEAVTTHRHRAMQGLSLYFASTCVALSGVSVDMSFQQGWVKDNSLEEALAASRDRDIARGSSSSGPHRADVTLRVEGRPAREVLSRGQQKLVAIALTLSQIEFVRDQVGVLPTLLLDDPAAELDSDRLQEFIGRVRGLNTQLVVTSLHPDSALFGAPDAMFHVEHGTVKRV